MRSYRLGLLLPALVVGLTYACSGSDGSSSQSGAVLDPSCKSDTANPPHTLLCTGLYKDIKAKTINPGIEAYTPATPLWSDGAEKSRWIQLPPGKTIDTTDPNEWKFPVGTQAWKEFKVGNKRVETRLWRKITDTSWANATYAWNADDTAATVSAGGDVAGPSGTYHIPTNDECQECHRGRKDRLLGFEQISLGLDGAQGYTLSQLVADKKLSPVPSSTSLSVGDDGTHVNAPAMRWLHINCGVTCHNTDPNSFANSVGMNLRMDPTTLTGGSASDYQDRATTIGVATKTPAFNGVSRIAPGDPDNSILYFLISHRGEGQQMPPIATNVVDDADVANVKAWIAAMGPPPGDDDDDDTTDAGTDSGTTDSGTTDSGTDSGSPVDAGAPDANTSQPTDAGALCQAGSVQETEQNDSAGSADVMTSGPSSFCGRLTPSDNDYFSWVMPANTNTWSVSDNVAGGAVTIVGTVNGQSFTLGAGGTYPFFPGMTYVFHASSAATTNVDYELAITLTTK